jgi:exodeoxyribonuclease VII small subunit
MLIITERTLFHISPETQATVVQKRATTGWTSGRNYFNLSPMSKSAKPGDSAKASSLPFEEALQKLEGIVETMEAGDLPLEALISRYEEGARLAKICQEKLAEAELKIQQLEKNAAGEMKLKPFEKDIES